MFVINYYYRFAVVFFFTVPSRGISLLTPATSKRRRAWARGSPRIAHHSPRTDSVHVSSPDRVWFLDTRYCVRTFMIRDLPSFLSKSWAFGLSVFAFHVCPEKVVTILHNIAPPSRQLHGRSCTASADEPVETVSATGRRISRLVKDADVSFRVNYPTFAYIVDERSYALNRSRRRFEIRFLFNVRT